MTPAEKAVSLVDYFMAIVKDLEAAKKCAVKVCQEVINIGPTRIIQTGIMIYDVEYWNQVIEQIKAIR